MTWPGPADEGRHPPAADRRWEEAWQLDLSVDDGALGASIRLALVPHERRAEVEACLVRDGRRLVTMVEHEAPLPRPGALDLRCEGLWTDLVCETPLVHWTVGLEAFGVALDEPADAYRGLRGERIGLGFDLEWESSGEAVAGAAAGGDGAGSYLVPCEVHGEVLVGAEVLAVAGRGTRRHRWGVSRPAVAAAGWLDDGTWWHAEVPGGGAGDGTGAVMAPGAPATGGPAQVEPGGAERVDGLPAAATVALGELELELAPHHAAPVPLAAPDERGGRLAQGLCRVTAADGRRGTAWAAWHRPPR